MAKTLLDTIQKRLEQPQGQPVAGVTDQTERVQGLLRAKLGKETAPSAGPRLSNIQEQQAAAQARLGAQRLQTEGQLAGQEVQQRQEQIQAQEQEQLKDIQERQKDVQAQYERQSEALLQDLERGKLQLKDRRDTAQVEQLGQQIRLQNRDYINQLQREGARARLDNMTQFKEQLAKEQFTGLEQVLNTEISYQQIAQQSDREWREELNQMDINTALEIAEADRLGRIKRAPWQILGAGIAGGTAIAGSGESRKSMFAQRGGEARTNEETMATADTGQDTSKIG